MNPDRAAVAQVFLAEAEERMGRMEEALLALQGTPTHPDIVEGILRDAGAIRAQTVSLGYADLAETIETLEEILEALRTGALPVTAEITSRLLDGIHGLREMVAEAATGEGELRPEHRSLVVRPASGARK